MRQKLSRILAAYLVTAMIFSGNISGTALAFEGDEAGTQKEEMQTNEQENVNNEDIQEEKNTGGSDNTESKTGSEGEPTLQEPEEEKQSPNDEEIDGEVETQTPELQKSQETQLSVNYIYMDKLSVYSGETQNVVLSLNQGTSQIENVVLVYSDDAGNKYQWQSEKNNSGLFLFEKTVSEETKGIYHIISINYNESGEEKEMLLSDIDMNISFGINCEYDGNNSSESLEMKPMGQEPEVTATVATIDENGVLNETAELGVAEALTEIGKETKSTQLRYRSAKSGNVVVVLDPGHDSGHAGAQGNGVQEEIATLKIAQYCKEELEKYSGVTVYMTRTTAACPFPETVGVGSGNILDIKKRVQWAASKGADAFVSFHLDSAGASAHGAHVYYPGDWFANNNIVSQGANLANAIQNELVGIGLYNRGTESADYSVNTESAKYGFPGLIIEHAFLTNVNDANTYLKTEAGLKKLGVADANGIVKYFGLTKGQWVQEGDKWKYKENGVFVVSDWRSINGKEYYFNKSGYRVTGWENIGGKEYYFMPEGYMWTGWASFGGTKYYFMPEGYMWTGWASFGNEKYYFDAAGRMQTGWQDIDGKRYYFMPEGYMWTGWASFGGTKYYFMPEGYMWTGWASFGGAKYYFDNQGRMLTGEQTIEGEKYIFNSEGILQSNQKSGWETREGKKYYYRNGQMQTGWQDIDGKRYYFMPEGYMWTGWASFGGTKYYFMPEGYMWTGWASFGGAKYYFDNQGRMLTGEQTIEGEKYIFNSEGILQSNQKSGWETREGKKYYYRNGQMQTGWQDIDGKRYYFMPEGYMWIGWASFGGERYYFDGNGHMIEGVYTVEGIQYQFNSKGILIGECSKYYMIEGATETTINQMINYYQSSGHRYPAEVLKKGGAETLEKFCTIFYNEALKENIKAEVAFVQTMKETGWLQFGGDVKIEQFNFAGLGATGNGVSGNSFKDVETGVRAQIQHLKAYGSVLPLNQTCVDQRFEYVKRGSAIYVEWLGIPDNPDGKGWASAEGYGFDLHKMIDKLLACGR